MNFDIEGYLLDSKLLKKSDEIERQIKENEKIRLLSPDSSELHLHPMGFGGFRLGTESII